MASNGPPVRVGGGYIEVRPKLVGLADFKRQLKARFETLGKEASKSLLKGVQAGMDTEIKTLTGALSKAAAAQIKANAEVAKSAARSSKQIADSHEDAAKRRNRWDKWWADQSNKHIAEVKRLYAGLFDEIERRSRTAAEAQRRHEAAQRAAFEAEFRGVLNQTNRMVQAAHRTVSGAETSINRTRRAMSLLNREISTSTAQTSRTIGQLRIWADEANRTLSYIADSVRQYGNRLQSFGQSWTAYVTTPILGSIGVMAQWGITTAAELQKAEIGITAMLHSLQGLNETMASNVAKSSLAELRRYAEETAFSFADMANGVQRLVASGLKAGTAVQWIKILGDTAATFGAGADEMRRAIIGLTQSLAAGRILAQDMNQLVNAGIPIWDLMSKALGKSRAEIMEMGKEGRLLSSQVLPQVMKYLQRFEGNAARMAEAVPLENLRNKFEQFRNSLADIFLEPKNANELNAFIDRLGVSLQKVVPIFENFVRTLLPLLNQGLSALNVVLNQLAQHPALGTLTLMAAAAGPLAIAFGLLARTVGFALGPFGSLVRLFGRTVDSSGRLRMGILGASNAVRSLGKSVLWLAGLPAFAAVIKGAGRLVATGAKKGAQAAVGVLSPGAQLAVGAAAFKVSQTKDKALGVVGALVSKIPGIKQLLPLLTKLRALIATPWGAAGIAVAVAALTGLGAALIGAWKKSEQFRAAVLIIWGQVRDIFIRLKEAFASVFSGETASNVDSLSVKLQQFGDWLANTILPPIIRGLDWVRQNFDTLFAGAVLGFTTFADIIWGNVQPALSGLWSILSSLFSMIGSVVKVVWTAVTQFLQWIGVTDSVSSATKGVTVEGGNLGRAIVLTTAAFQTFGKVMNAVASMAKVNAEALAGLFTIVGRTADALGKLLRGDFKGAWDSFSAGFGDALKRINDAAMQTGKKILDALNIKGTYEQAAKQFNDLFNRSTNAKPTKVPKTKAPSVVPPTTLPSGAIPSSGSGSGKSKSGGNKKKSSKKKKDPRKAAEAAKKRFESAKKTLLDSFRAFLDALKGDADQVKKAGETLAKNVESAFDRIGKYKAGDKAAAYLRDVNKKLVAIAKERDKILATIEEAKDFQSSVTSAAKESASFGNLPYSLTTAEGIKVGLQERLAKIKQFVAAIKDLAKRGLNKNLLRQVVDMGPIDGLALANTLLAADKETFAAINAAQSEIDKTASQLGTTATEVIFGSIKELEAKGKSLQQQMEKIAKQAITKVARQFGVGWTEIRKITGDGMNKTNKALNDKLKVTKSTVTSTTKAVTQSWSTMVKDMNKVTGQMVSVTYNKGAKAVVNTMASIANVGKPLPTLKFAEGTEDHRAQIAPAGAMRVWAEPETGGEAYIPLAKSKRARSTEILGKVANVFGYNLMPKNAKQFANGGIDGARWVNRHKDDPFEGYEEAMKAALKAVVDPARKILSSWSRFGGIESGDVKSQYPALLAWAKKLDKLAFGSAAAVIKVAKGEIGQGDRGGVDNNLNKYNMYNGEPWCADFVSWVVDHARANKAYWNSPTGTPRHRWPAVAQWVSAAGGKRPVSTARPGDLATYGGTAHINLVVKNLGNGRLLTIGGNQGPLVESGIRTNADGVLRPRFAKLGGKYVNPWPGSLNIPITGHHDLGGGTDGGGGTPAKNRALGKRMAADRGWGSQWKSLDNLWTRESGWNHLARNPISGAYGIPQALPASKMASAGPDWRTNPATQIRWGLGYIKGRYGDPNAAWAFWRRHHWYERGAWEIPNNNHPAVLHKGEMVLPAKQAEAFRDALRGHQPVRSGGDTINNITLNALPDQPTERQILRALKYAEVLYQNRRRG